MLDFNKPSIRKQIASIFITIAKNIEEDEEFAKSIFRDYGKSLLEKQTKESPSPKQGTNLFEIYQTQGSTGLLKVLESLELRDLKKIVVEHGLDPAQKVRRWRSKEKIINVVIDSVGKQMAKGGAFLK